MSQVELFVDDTQYEHVCVRQGLRSSQLTVTGVSVLDSPYLLTELSVPARFRALRLAAIAEFNRTRLATGPAGKRSPGSASPRLRFVLEALDGHLAGSSQRDIATELFGHRRVAAEWHTGGGHMRDRVRRAIGRGRYMMNSGYLELLRR